MTALKEALKQRLSEISDLERAHIRKYKQKQLDKRMAGQGVQQDIPGFTGLAVMKHGNQWYIIDKEGGKPIGPYHSTKGAAVRYAQDEYKGQYESTREANLRDQGRGIRFWRNSIQERDKTFVVKVSAPRFIPDQTKTFRTEGEADSFIQRQKDTYRRMGIPDVKFEKNWHYLDTGTQETGQFKRSSVREQGQVATTIWKQISTGTKMAVGARNAVGGGNKLHFNVGRGKTNKIEVIYNPGSDLYTVKLWKFGRNMLDQKVVEEATGVYGDQLSDVIYRMVNK